MQHQIGVNANSVFPYIYHPQTKFAKVMFSQVSVCPRGGDVAKGGRHGRGGMGGIHGRGWACVVGGMCMAEETATAAGGMHPTGMHSC